MCRLDQADKGETYCTGRNAQGKCPFNRIPFLESANVEIWELFQLILPGAFNGMGGYNYEAIRFVFEAHGVEKDKWAGYINKIIILLDVVRRLSKKDG